MHVEGGRSGLQRGGEECAEAIRALTPVGEPPAPPDLSCPTAAERYVSAEPPVSSGRVVILPERRGQGQTWEPWLNEAAIARFFGVSTRTVRRGQHAGMPSEKYGGLRRYRLSACEGWLRRGRGEERSA